MTPPFSVLLVDADAYRLQRHVLDVSHDPEFFVAKSCTSKRQAQTYLQRHAVDFAVINMRLPDGNGADLIRTVLRKNPQAHVLVATDISDENIVMQAITAGANGYVLFSDIPTSTVNCLRLLLSGGSPVSPVIARSVLRSLQYRSSMADVPPQSLLCLAVNLTSCVWLHKALDFPKLAVFWQSVSTPSQHMSKKSIASLTSIQKVRLFMQPRL